MASVIVQPGTWELISDEVTDVSFRFRNFKGRVVRSVGVPVGKVGVTIDSDRNSPSELMSYGSDGINSVYVYNSGTTVGTVERDL